MFWKYKAIQHTLEELVKNIVELTNEFRNSKEPKKEEVETKINIHYQPEVELAVFIDGVKIISEDKSREMFDKLVALRKTKDVTAIYDLILPKRSKTEEEEIQDEEKRIEEVVKNVHYLLQTGDFEVKDDSVYAIGINRSLPKLLVDRLTEAHSNNKLDEYKSLKMFWYWCCLNPIAPVADNLFDFLNKGEVPLRLNKNGFFYALRNVDKVEGCDHELVEAISQHYTKIKGWKKSPKNFELYTRLGEYQLVKGENAPKDDNPYWKKVGNLQELYNNLSEMKENRYTDNWTRTMDIRVGKKVRMNPEDCHWDTVNCGDGGLHFTLTIRSYQCGNAEMLILINPATVVGFGSQKGRCYEYLPLCAMERNEAKELLMSGDFDTTAIEDVDYEEEMQGLEEKVKASFTAEAKRYNLISRPYEAVNGDTIQQTIQKIVDITTRVQMIS